MLSDPADYLAEYSLTDNMLKSVSSELVRYYVLPYYAVAKPLSLVENNLIDPVHDVVYDIVNICIFTAIDEKFWNA